MNEENNTLRIREILEWDRDKYTPEHPCTGRMTDIPEYVMDEPTMDVDIIIKRYSNLVVAYNNLVDSYVTVVEERNDLMRIVEELQHD